MGEVLCCRCSRLVDIFYEILVLRDENNRLLNRLVELVIEDIVGETVEEIIDRYILPGGGW